jgi:hypothetical protein
MREDVLPAETTLDLVQKQLLTSALKTELDRFIFGARTMARERNHEGIPAANLHLMATCGVVPTIAAPVRVAVGHRCTCVICVASRSCKAIATGELDQRVTRSVGGQLCCSSWHEQHQA